MRRMSASRWESDRKLQACGARRYQAVTVDAVRAMLPSIERSAMAER